MIVWVKDEYDSSHYVNVPSDDRDKARKAAFRYIYKRREKDYNELAHHALEIDVTDLSPDAVSILLSHV